MIDQLNQLQNQDKKLTAWDFTEDFVKTVQNLFLQHEIIKEGVMTKAPRSLPALAHSMGDHTNARYY